jgi:uncharacterized protein (DUF433 family)
MVLQRRNATGPGQPRCIGCVRGLVPKAPMSRLRSEAAEFEHMVDGVGSARVGLVMDYRDRIVIEPEVRFGKPTVRGTRITVGDVLSYLAGGMSEEDILADFPQLARDDIRACLAFAADRERRLASVPA